MVLWNQVRQVAPQSFQDGGSRPVQDLALCFLVTELSHNVLTRFCSLPVGALALLVAIFILRKLLLGPQPIPELDETPETGRRTRFIARLKIFDVGGQVLFILGFGLIILALTWGGVSYPWASAAVVVSLVFGCLFVVMFVYWEYLLAPGNRFALKMPWQKAMIPWNLMSNRDIGLLFYGECGTGMAMYSVLYFCNIYFTTVRVCHVGSLVRLGLTLVPGLHCR